MPLFLAFGRPGSVGQVDGITPLHFQRHIENEGEEKVPVQPGRSFAPQIIQRDKESDAEEGEEAGFEQDEEGLTLEEIGGMIAQAIMKSPPHLAQNVTGQLQDVEGVFANMQPGELFFESLNSLYLDLFALAFELLRMPEGEQTTPDQRKRATDLARKWSRIQDDMAAHNKRKARRDLKEAREASAALRLELLYAYRDVYAAGEEPEDVQLGSFNLKDLAEKTKDLLQAINEADANISGRSVTPLIPVLDNTLSVVNLITGWKAASGLAAPSTKDFMALQNALSLGTTVAGLAGFGKFLPFFSHIGPLLDGISKGWSRLVRELQKKNARWWEAREVMGEDSPHPEALPGGRQVLDYMKRIFRRSSPPSGHPSEAVIDFFDENRDMFTKAPSEVMGENWPIPTESSWIFWTKVAPDKLNTWVYYNRDMVWRLIYGRDMEPPS